MPLFISHEGGRKNLLNLNYSVVEPYRYQTSQLGQIKISIFVMLPFELDRKEEDCLVSYTI